jgi:hypothetical protein
MKLYKHKNYQEYLKLQIEESCKYKSDVWFNINEIKIICNDIRSHIKHPRIGICHGVRSGLEIKIFSEILEGVEVIGTEISKHSVIFERDKVSTRDFHNLKFDWFDKFDFIYSNSFDHSQAPTICLENWMLSLKSGGRCYIHWEDENSKGKDFNASNCFVATIEEMRDWVGKKYKVKELMCLNDNLRKEKERTIFVLEKP